MKKLLILVAVLLTAATANAECDWGIFGSWECEIQRLQERVIGQRIAEEIPYAFGLPVLAPRDELPNLPGRNDLPDLGPARDDLPDMGKK